MGERQEIVETIPEMAKEIVRLRSENERLRMQLDVHLDLCGEQAGKIILLERELRRVMTGADIHE